MRNATLTRMETGDEGTFGKFCLDDGYVCRSGELPWRDNQTGQSCIPVGTYTCSLINSPKHGPCYLLHDVPNRGDVEIHSANWMGDKSKGLQCQLLGCIALGEQLGELEGQRAVLASKDAITEFMKRMAGEPFNLTITEAYS